MPREKTTKIFLMSEEMVHNQVGKELLHVLTGKLQQQLLF